MFKRIKFVDGSKTKSFVGIGNIKENQQFGLNNKTYKLLKEKFSNEVYFVDVKDTKGLLGSKDEKELLLEQPIEEVEVIEEVEEEAKIKIPPFEYDKSPVEVLPLESFNGDKLKLDKYAEEQFNIKLNRTKKIENMYKDLLKSLEELQEFKKELDSLEEVNTQL